MKPLLRWTVGNANQQGLDILAESTKRTTKALGDQFDYVVCHNNTKPEDLEFLKANCVGVDFYKQNHMECSIPELRDESQFRYLIPNPKGIPAGSIWKMAPLRLRPNAHEIVIDNDVVIISRHAKLEEFLAGDKMMLAGDKMPWYGRFAPLIGDRLFNSGVIGFPPGGNLHVSRLRRVWEGTGRLRNLLANDEQGLLALTFGPTPHIYLDSSTEMVELHKDGEVFFEGSFRMETSRPYKFKGTEFGFHFVTANRETPHLLWEEFREWAKAQDQELATSI